MQDSHTRATAFSWLDLKIPLWGIISLFIALAGQTAGLLIWGTNLSAQTAANAAAITDLQLKATSAQSLAVIVARIDERTQGMAVTISHLDQQREAPH